MDEANRADGSDGERTAPAAAAFGGAAAAAVARGGERALVWAVAGGEPLVLRFDDAGRVLAPVRLAAGGWALSVPDGASLLACGPDAAELHAEPRPGATPLRFGRAGEGAEAGGSVRGAVRIATAGAHAGRLAFAARLAPDASLRYCYRAGASELSGIRYPLFPADPRGAVAVAVELTPGAQARVGVDEDEPLPSCFTTTGGHAVRIGAISPQQSRLVQQWDPVDGAEYAAPDGEWRLLAPTGMTGSSVDVLLGLSGLEFARVPATGATVTFVADSPAYADHYGPAGASGPVSLTATCPLSSRPVTTAWVYFAEPDGPTGWTPGYYSQPREAGMFDRRGADPVLHQLPLRAAGFPPGAGVLGAPAASFPAAPYAGATASGPVGGGWPGSAVRFEEQVLTPQRTRAIDDLNAPPPAAGVLAGPTALAVTPQGLESHFTSGYASWDRLVLARSRGGADELALTAIDGRLRTALLSSELFLVISDPAAIAPHLAPGARLTIDDWTFPLDPASWSTDKARPTMLIVKACEASIATLARDWHQWTDPSLGNADPAQAAAVLQQVVADGRAGGAYFADTVLHDWNGVLLLNCRVPGERFPPELRGLAAGISGEPIAHHVGSNGAPIAPGAALRTGDSSLFGLIDYRNPGDLVYEGDPYAFKVLSLHVDFANSHVAGFASRVELLIGELFGEHTANAGGEHGDNLLFEGTWQRRGEHSAYGFRATSANLYLLDGAVLSSVTLDGGDFTTLEPDPAQPDRVVSLFTLGGVLRFHALPQLDAFSFGTTEDQSAAAIDAPGLVAGGLVVRMTTTGSGAQRVTEFAFLAGDATLDLATSRARPGSLYAKFPLRATGLLQGEGGAKPAGLGYTPVATPLRPGPLASRWFALALELDLGSAGGLAAASELTAGLALAWSPARPPDYDVQVGLRLPGAQSGDSSVPLMGPLRLDVGAMRLLADEDGFLLRLEKIALGFLGLTFPPGGQTNLLLFGNPDPSATTDRLGWYGAYRKDPEQSAPPAPPPRPPGLPAPKREAR